MDWMVDEMRKLSTLVAKLEEKHNQSPLFQMLVDQLIDRQELMFRDLLQDVHNNHLGLLVNNSQKQHDSDAHINQLRRPQKNRRENQVSVMVVDLRITEFVIVISFASAVCVRDTCRTLVNGDQI